MEAVSQVPTVAELGGQDHGEGCYRGAMATASPLARKGRKETKMTKAEAATVHQGTLVIDERGQERRVNSIMTRGMAAPYFRLQGVQDGAVSYRLCSLPRPTA